VSRAPSTAQHQYSSWDRARLSIVVPIGVIVAVAILCIIVAVLSSAQRADEISLESERQMVARAIRNHSARVLREVESIASSDDAVLNLRENYNASWAQKRLGIWLDTYFDHDAVFLIDPFGKIIYGHSRWRRPDDTWYAMAKADLLPVLRALHNATSSGERHRTVRVENFIGRPAIIAAVVVGNGPAQATDETGAVEGTPVVMSVRIIDQDVLSDIAAHLRIKDLRRINNTQAPAGDFVFGLDNADGVTLAHFAWTPSQPGAEIVNNVLPFLAAALAGFTLLGIFVLRYMRRTAAAIIAGETRLHHLAMHDPLSGLPNRTYFSERLEAIIAEVKYGGPPAVLLYIDLDHFKEVNDTLGHHVGDELIRNVTLRLSNVLRSDDSRSNDLVARLGGDEFAVLAAIGADPEAMTALANRILTTLCAPYSISNQTIVIGASIGIAVIDNKNAVAADIMRYADMALYRAKNEGRNRACIYDAVMDADLSSRKLLEIDLREAIVNDGFRLLYQPQVNSSGETLVGVEALCRWNHPTRGPIPPSEFIPVAEHSGLIVDLGQWVLRRACLEAHAWPGLSLAVNVSPLQFRRADFVSVVQRILAETNFDPKRLELELTESTLLGNFEVAESAMRRL
jgi:diguanylate cyclase (GGDEF)-like protein